MLHFKKITPVNGFDANDPNNAMQNNYAWSMAELGDYIYVGTGRNIAYFAMSSIGFDVPEALTPPGPILYNAEIWRCRMGTDEWEFVYRPPDNLQIMGLRFMINYKNILYAGTMAWGGKVIILKSSPDGTTWSPLITDISGSNTRAMAIHDGKLYMGVLEGATGGGAQPQLYVTTDPATEGWERVDLAGDPELNPRGGIDAIISYNNKLYVSTSPPGGFELWRTTGKVPQKDGWKLVVDKGGGDALNEWPLTLGIFKNQLYLGTGIPLAIQSTDPAKEFVPPKGADLFRVYKNDKWELIIGSEPVAPTTPTTGMRNKGKYTSGLGDLSNAYIWQLREHNGRFYLGTFDWSVLLPYILISLFTQNKNLIEEKFPGINELNELRGINSQYNWVPWLESLAESLVKLPYSMGFDLYVSDNGKNWCPISLNGFNNPHNYGIRNLLNASDGHLYVGTANPFEGCEVWVSAGFEDDLSEITEEIEDTITVQEKYKQN